MKYDIHIANFYNSLLTIIIILITFPFSSFISIAEEIPGPEGEQVLRQHFFKNNGQVSRIIATRYNIYSSHYSFSEGWSKAKRMFSVPYGKRIVDACKKFADNEEKKTYCILLDDGTIYEFKYKARTDFFDGAPKITKGPDNLSSQLNYSNLLVSDYYRLILNNTLFFNLLDGKGWNSDSVGIGTYSVYSLCLNTKGELFVGTNKGLFKKDNQRFERISSVDTFTVISLFNDRSGKMHLNLSSRKTMISLDSGRTFQDDSTGIGSRTVIRFGDDRWGNVYAITSTQYVNRIYKKSTNTDWIRIDTNFTNYLGFYSSINDISGETTLEISAYYGSYSSRDDGVNWFSSNSGILAEDIFRFIILDNGKLISYSLLGIFIKDKDSTNWTKIFPETGISSNYFLMKDRNNNLFTQINRSFQQNQGNIYKSTDLGGHWELDTNGIYILPRGYTGYSQLYIDENGVQHYANCFVYGAQNNSLRIYEKKANEIWTLDTLGLGLPSIPTNQLYSIGNFAQFGDDLYISGALWDNISGSYFLRNGLFFKRKLDDTIWEIDTLGIGNYAIYSIESDKNGNLYLGSLALNGNTSKIIKKTPNTWKFITLPPASTTDINDISIDSSGNLWVVFNNTSLTTSMYRGIYTTTDEGLNWEYAGFDNVNVRGLVAHNDKMYAYTSRGIHSLSKAPFKQPKIQISSKFIDFGKHKPGTSVDTLIQIQNTGEDTLRITSISFNSIFSPSLTRITIAPGTSKEFLITFKPLSAMTYTYTMRIISNDFPDSIVLKGEGILTDSSAKILLSNKNINFGEVRSGKTKDTTIILNNIGLETLIVYNINSSTSAFSIQDRSFELPAGMSKELVIRFSPTSIRTYNGYLYIQSNVLPDTIWVTGVGIEAAAPKLSLSLKNIDFGKVEVGLSKDTSVLFKNIGTDTLRVSYIRTFSESFSTSHHQFVLAPEEEILVTLTFKPQEEKIYNEYFAIVSNTTPDTIFVQGKGYYFVHINEENCINSNPVIYPNPTSYTLFIKLNDNDINNNNIKIYNQLGIEVLNLKNINLDPKNRIYEFDVSNLSQGTYYLSIMEYGKTKVYLINIIK